LRSPNEWKNTRFGEHFQVSVSLNTENMPK